MTDNQGASTKMYLAIWGWLAVLMLLGVLLSERNILPFPRWGVVLTIVGLSSVKAVLVGMYYMHLKMERRLLAFIALGPLVLVAIAVCVVLSSNLVHF